MMRRPILFSVGFLVLVLVAVTIFFVLSPNQRVDENVSGVYLGDEHWSGEITVTGDVMVLGSLRVEPGTIVRFVIGDDRGWGDEVEADGFNDSDPTRLETYTKTHASLFVFRKLTAIGTEDKPITFTSAAEKPNLADWESVVFQGNGSVLDRVVVEYSRNGLNPIGDQPDSVIKNSTVRHTLWGAISSANSSIQILNNRLSDAGHEGIDLGYPAAQIVRGNIIDDCHTGMAVTGGSAVIEGNMITNCGDGIFVYEKSSSRLSNNTFIPAPDNSTREWRYGGYVIPIFGGPEL